MMLLLFLMDLLCLYFVRLVFKIFFTSSISLFNLLLDIPFLSENLQTIFWSLYCILNSEVKVLE